MPHHEGSHATAAFKQSETTVGKIEHHLKTENRFYQPNVDVCQSKAKCRSLRRAAAYRHQRAGAQAAGTSQGGSQAGD